METEYGIGKATAIEFAKIGGYKVVINYLTDRENVWKLHEMYKNEPIEDRRRINAAQNIKIGLFYSAVLMHFYTQITAFFGNAVPDMPGQFGTLVYILIGGEGFQQQIGETYRSAAFAFILQGFVFQSGGIRRT